MTRATTTLRRSRSPSHVLVALEQERTRPMPACNSTPRAGQGIARRPRPRRKHSLAAITYSPPIKRSELPRNEKRSLSSHARMLRLQVEGIPKTAIQHLRVLATDTLSKIAGSQSSAGSVGPNENGPGSEPGPVRKVFQKCITGRYGQPAST